MEHLSSGVEHQTSTITTNQFNNRYSLKDINLL
jgi:hypothetical protein